MRVVFDLGTLIQKQREKTSKRHPPPLDYKVIAPKLRSDGGGERWASRLPTPVASCQAAATAAGTGWRVLRNLQVVQPVVDADAVLVDDLESRSDAAAVTPPQNVLDVVAGVPALVVEVGVSVHRRPAPVAIDLGPSFERVFVHQTYIALVKQSVLGLEDKKVS